MNKDILKTIKDEKGRIVREALTHYSGNGYWAYQEYKYDQNDKIIEERTYGLDGSLKYTEFNEYDDKGNITKTATYDENNYIINSTNYYYDAENKLIKAIKDEEEESNYKEDTTVDDIIKDGLEEDCESEDDMMVYMEFYWDDSSEIIEYEYNEEGKLTQELLKTKHGTLLMTRKYEYDSPNTEKHIAQLSNGRIISIITTEDIDNNEVITKFFDRNNNLTKEDHDYYNSNDEIIKAESKEANGETTIINYSNGKEIERIVRNAQNELIHHHKRNYDKNGILESIEILGEERHEINAQNSKYLTKDLKIKFNLAKSIFLFKLLTITPILLSVGLFSIYISIRIMSEDSHTSIFFIIFGIIASALAIYTPIHVLKEKYQYITYTYDVSKGKIKIENMELDGHEYSNIREYNKKDLFVPIIFNLNAISSGVFLSGDKYHGDRLVLIINKNNAIQIPLTVKILNILKSFIKIENLGFFPQIFIKNDGSDHDLSEVLKKGE